MLKFWSKNNYDDLQIKVCSLNIRKDIHVNLKQQCTASTNNYTNLFVP